MNSTVSTYIRGLIFFSLALPVMTLSRVQEMTPMAMPTAYSISEGIAIGIISWTIINVITGKAKEKKISPLMYVLTVLFILKYVCL